MKKFLLSVKDILLFPNLMDVYSPFARWINEHRILSLEKDLPSYHPIPSLYAFYLNALFIFSFGFALFLSGVSLSKIFVLALTLFGGSLLAGSVNLTIGISLLLFGIFFATQNTNIITAPEPQIIYWWLGLPALFTFAGIYAHRLSHPVYSPFHKIWKLLLGVSLTCGGLYFVYVNSYQLLSLKILISVLALSYALAAPVKKAETIRADYKIESDFVSSIGSTVFFLTGVIILWQLYIQVSGNYSTLLKALLFSALMGGGVILITIFIALPSYVDEMSASESKRPFYRSEKRWLFLLFYLSLQIVLEPLIAVPAAFLGIVLVGLSFTSINRFQENVPPVFFAFVYAMGGAIWLYLISGYILDSAWWNLSLALLKLPHFLSLPWMIFAFSALIFSLIGSYWLTNIGIYILISLLFIISGNISLLPISFFSINFSLIAGMILGYSKVLVWPFLSFFSYMEYQNIKKQQQLSKEQMISAIEMVEFRSWLHPFKRISLMTELIMKGLSETDLKLSSSKKLFKKVKESMSQDYLESDFTIGDLVNRGVLGLSPSIQEIIVLLKNVSNDDISRFEKAKAYAKALKLLQEKMKTTKTGVLVNWTSALQELEIIKKIANQVLIELKPLAENFREVNKCLEKQVISEVKNVERFEISYHDQKTRRVIEEKIDQNLNAAISFIDLVITLVEENPSWETTDTKVILAFHAARSTLNTFNSRRFDFLAQQRIVQSSLDGLKITRPNIENTIFVLNLSSESPDIVEEENPWIKIVDHILQLLDEVNYLLNLHVDWAKKYLVKIIEQMDSLEKLARAEKMMEPLSGLGEKYNPVIDETIYRLILIGREASSALAFPGGFSRRLGLQDTIERLNELRSLLSTRFLVEANEILEPLNLLSQMLHSALYKESDNKSIGFRNPYQVGNPIQGSRAVLFKGRFALLQKILVILRSRSTPTFLLHGPRRMGKTSFLLQLPSLLPSDLISIYVDMQAGGATQSDSQFFLNLANVIFSQTDGKLHLEKPNPSLFNKKPYLAFAQWLEALKPQIKESTLFFMIDEFETIGKRISDGILTIQVLEYLRHLMQHNENIIFLFAGVQTLDALGPNSASYFIGVYPLEISYLSPKETEELIRNPDPSAGDMPEYSKNVVKEIIKITKCQPYLVQAICSEIIGIATEKSISRITMRVLQDAIERVLAGTGVNYFKYLWDYSEKEGRDILVRIIANPQTKFSSAKIKILKELMQKQIVTKLDDQSYTVEVPLFEMWIRNQE